MKTQNPWMGRARGSAGNMTSSKVYDKNVMRAKAFEVNNPKTAAQTNERNFFADAQKVCQTVSEDQLRSLFGVKPKTKSRRNALLSQLLEAFSINDGVKEFDFSKLEAIGNGKKVSTPIVPITNGLGDDSIEWTSADLPDYKPNISTYFYVCFDVDNKRIFIEKKDPTDDESFSGEMYDNDVPGLSNGYFYMTIASNGEDTTDKNFGSFVIKTRAV